MVAPTGCVERAAGRLERKLPPQPGCDPGRTEGGPRGAGH